MATKPQTTPIRPVLNLDTQSPPEHVTIDGVGYDLRAAGDLSIQQTVRLMQLTPRHDDLIARQATLTEDEFTELGALLKRIVPLILEAPDDVHARLNENQRLQIVVAFTGLSRRLLDAPRATNGATMETTAPARPSRGTSTSRGSSGSTGARRARG